MSYDGVTTLGVSESLSNEIDLKFDGDQWSFAGMDTRNYEFEPIEILLEGDVKVYIKP